MFVRDNLSLEMYEANNDESEGLWTRGEHPGNDPDAMRRFQQLGEVAFMDEKKVEVQRFIREHPGRFVWFTMKRAVYFWIAPPQAAIVAGYDLMISRHVNFLVAALFAFAGLWLTIRNRVPGGSLLACFLLIYPFPYYLVNPFPRYKHPIEPVMLMFVVYLFSESRKIEIHWPFSRTRSDARHLAAHRQSFKLDHAVDSAKTRAALRVRRQRRFHAGQWYERRRRGLVHSASYPF